LCYFLFIIDIFKYSTIQLILNVASSSANSNHDDEETQKKKKQTMNDNNSSDKVTLHDDTVVPHKQSRPSSCSCFSIFALLFAVSAVAMVLMAASSDDRLSSMPVPSHNWLAGRHHPILFM
jgi:hypothetical protein